MDKAKLNYWLDAAIAVAFLLSAISGLVFLLPVGLGSGSVILGLSYQVWDALHVWSTLAMIAGVLVHLVLHRKWIVSMTRRMLQKSPRVNPPESVESVPQVVWIDVRSRHMSRREFLRLSAVTAAGIGLGVLGYTAIGAAGSSATSEDIDGDRALSPTTDQPVLQEDDGDQALPAATEQAPQQQTGIEEAQSLPTPTLAPTVAPPEPDEICVACPRGMVNDPYPGRCRRYTDANDNGTCDFSEPGSGNNCVTTEGGVETS